MEVFNAGEVVSIDEIRMERDSIHIYMPVFEGYISARSSGEELRGRFRIESLDRSVPFMARYGERPRFLVGPAPLVDLSGAWEVVFSPGTADEYPAKGIFRQEGDQLSGTFRTTTGDYRYLQGVVTGDSLKLSTFDGAHAFLFLAGMADSVMRGTFYSGNHFKEPFVGRRSPDYQLPDARTLTYLKPGYDQLEFEFPGPDGALVSLRDQRFNRKAVVVQIMGTWCPNCLDETRFLTDYMALEDTADLEVVALAFEYARTREAAFSRIRRLRERLGMEYPILLAQYGSSDKLLAQEKLPMLNQLISYPTTLFIDKEKNVRAIHTGFNGPATGAPYEAFKRQFDSLVRVLQAE